MNEEIVDVTKTSGDGEDHSQVKVERTDEEKVAFNLAKQAEKAKTLGLDPNKIIGGDVKTDEVPEWYKKEKLKETRKTAEQLADSIEDQDTREQVKATLSRIVPGDNPDEDFRLALGAVSSTKNKQVLEELNRYAKPRVVTSGSSQPAKSEEEFVPTEQETVFMKKPYNMSKEKILEARKKNQAKTQ